MCYVECKMFWDVVKVIDPLTNYETRKGKRIRTERRNTLYWYVAKDFQVSYGCIVSTVIFTWTIGRNNGNIAVGSFKPQLKGNTKDSMQS